MLDIGPWEFLVIILVGMFVFGPDKLPKAISDGVRMIRNLRNMARNATSDLGRELGTDIALEDLHPKTFIRKHLLSEDDERALRRPLESLYSDLRTDVQGIADATDLNKPTSGATPRSPVGNVPTATPAPTDGADMGDAGTAKPRRVIDIDAT